MPKFPEQVSSPEKKSPQGWEGAPEQVLIHMAHKAMGAFVATTRKVEVGTPEQVMTHEAQGRF